ncbi:MAG: fused MFS/spermidine synthase [Proteobacteria bacterium]|nr:fused MFS/spermidine synthase [Pseudomonadota bacterium]
MDIKTRARLLFIIFLNGYVSLALELIALRQVSYFVGSSAAVTSIVIGVYLAALSAGHFFGTKKFKADANKILGASFIASAIFVVLACSFPLIAAYFEFMARSGIHSHISQTFIYSFVFLSVAPFLFGFNTALLSQVLHEKDRCNTGIIMGVDTIGAVLGSLATTLIFMAIFGVNYTIILTIGLAGLGAYLSFKRLWVAAVFILILGAAWGINNDGFLYRRFNIVSSNPINTVAVIQARDGRWLMVDSAPHSYISRDGKSYAEYINYINDNFINPILSGDRRNILVLGAGGFTVGDQDDHNEYTFVDLDKTLPGIAEKYFLKKKLGANKKFVTADATQFLTAAETEYDFIFMDIFSRWDIPESAITTEFMSRMKARLRPGGIIAMNIVASPTFGDEYSRKIDNTIRAVFPGNLSRQIIGRFDGWSPNRYANVIYVYYNAPNSGQVYTPNKSSPIYDR